MKAALLFLLSFLTTSAFGQDHWKITHGGKLRLTSSRENETGNVVNLKSTDLKKSGFLILSYKEKTPQADWERIITLFDPQDNELLRHTGPLLKISNSELQSLFQKTKTIKIYSWSLPKDPELAARIRVRRVHLATVVIK